MSDPAEKVNCPWLDDVHPALQTATVSFALLLDRRDEGWPDAAEERCSQLHLRLQDVTWWADQFNVIDEREIASLTEDIWALTAKVTGVRR